MKTLPYLGLEEVALYSDAVCVYVKYNLKRNKIDVKLKVIETMLLDKNKL